MKRKYTNITRTALIKKINELEAEKKKREKEFSSVEIEELHHQLHLKEIQIENQKFELLDKQIQLEVSRDKYADLYDFAPNGYIILNTSGIIEDINLTGVSMLGVDANHAKGIPFIHFIVKDDVQKFLDFLRSCRKSNKRCIDEFTINNKKGDNTIIHITAISFQDYKTKKTSFRISIEDISEKRKAEKSLHESEERFRNLADNSPVMIWMTDADNKLVYMNKTKLNFFGKKFEELTNDVWMDTRHPDDKEKFINELFSAAKEMRDFSIEIRVKNKNGDYRWLLDSASPRILPDGSFVGFIGSGIDITERKNSRIKLEKSLKEKELLLKEVYHRVKNNLQVMSSLLSLQVRYITDEKALNGFKSSKGRISAMALLHENLYNSRNLSDIDFKEYIDSISKSLLAAYQNKAKDIKIKLDIEKISLSLDASINLGLIINELVSNSLKYAFKGKDKGRIDISFVKENKENLILKVSDNGIGLPDDIEIRKLNSLGLELVTNIVEQLQGKLEISKNGKTEFKITFKQNGIVNF